MNEYMTIIMALGIGAIAGTIRTYLTHGLKLVAPTFSFKDRIINLRLGWVASALLGGIMAIAAVTGFYWVFPEQPPDTIYNMALVAFSTGYASLEIVNKWVGGKLPDIDTYDSSIALEEINIEKAAIIADALSSLKCIERMQIRDQDVAGVVQVIIVPKPTSGISDLECKKQVEAFFGRHRQLGVQIYVTLPEIVMVDIKLKVILVDMPDIDTNEYMEKIECALTKYVNSLQPGQWVKKSQLVSRSIIDRFVNDIPGEYLETNPPIENGSDIPIDSFSVARAADIDITVEVTSPVGGGTIS